MPIAGGKHTRKRHIIWLFMCYNSLLYLAIMALRLSAMFNNPRPSRLFLFGLLGVSGAYHPDLPRADHLACTL